MANKFFVSALTVLFLLGHVAPSVAEEKKPGSFFSSNKSPNKKKFPSISTIFSKKAKEKKPDKTQDKGSETELTEEEKKLVRQAAKASGEELAPKEPAKLPAAAVRVKPRVIGWAVPVTPKIAKPPRNPNDRYQPYVPQAPKKYLENQTPQPPPKIAGSLKNGNTPTKKQR